MAEEAKTQHWWQTLPGMLTAVAAAVTALTGLIAALNQAGFLGRSRAPTSAATAHEAPPVARDAAGNGTAPRPDASPPVRMPDGREVTMRFTGTQYKYTVVSAQLEPLAPGKHLLRLRVRVWSDAAGGVVFWSDSFRLKIGDARLKPVNFLDELAARDETKEGDVEFEVDDSVREAVLSITVGGADFTGNTRDLRLGL